MIKVASFFSKSNFISTLVAKTLYFWIEGDTTLWDYAQACVFLVDFLYLQGGRQSKSVYISIGAVVIRKSILKKIYFF